MFRFLLLKEKYLEYLTIVLIELPTKKLVQI
jgi:hypothetical protein